MTPADITLHTMIHRLGWTPRGVQPHVCTFAEGTRSEVAIAGPDGARAANLLATAKARGTDVLTTITEKAVRRLLSLAQAGTIPAVPVLFDDDELKELQAAFQATIATADLLGRSRVRQFMARKEKRGEAGAPEKFAEPREFPDDPSDDPFHIFPDSVPFQRPEEAVDYFRTLVPRLGTDPYRYGALLERHAFTLAVAVDQTMLEKVKKIVADRLEGQAGAPFGTAVADIQDVLDAAGVSPANPQTAEMIFRTNMLDAMNNGQMSELQAMPESFPVWRYDGIRDGRQGEDHEPKFDKYYPVSAAFHDVRGPRIFNCRCCPTGIYRTDWADLQAKGARLETSW